jgi:phosphoribosylformylglycinamidine synthase
MSHGGLAVAAAEMALGGDVGVRIRLPPADLRFDIAAFSESNGRWLVEVRKGQEEAFESAMAGVPVADIGRVGGTDLSISRGGEAVVSRLPAIRKVWTEAIPKLVVVS